MTSASEIRAWGRENGFEVTARGNIPGILRDAYDAAHPHPNGSAHTDNPDYPDDEFAAAFEGAETAFGEPPDEEFDESVMREAPPRNPKGRPRSGTTRSRSGRLFGRKENRSSKGGGARGTGKRPRISTEDITGSVWRAVAKLATPLPPLNRTLRIQAPVAGMLLDDAVKGTMVDRVLQPLARIGAQGKVISALAGPPVLVTALSLHIQQRAAAGQEPNPLLMTAGLEALRSSLMAWVSIAGPKMLIAMKREQEFEEAYGKDVDEMIAFLLAPPVNPADEAAVQAEDDAIRRAQGILRDA